MGVAKINEADGRPGAGNLLLRPPLHWRLPQFQWLVRSMETTSIMGEVGGGAETRLRERRWSHPALSCSVGFPERVRVQSTAQPVAGLAHYLASHLLAKRTTSGLCGSQPQVEAANHLSVNEPRCIVRRCRQMDAKVHRN